jgi:hypothetical protein
MHKNSYTHKYVGLHYHLNCRLLDDVLLVPETNSVVAFDRRL